MSRASGYREGAVRFAPPFKSTEKSSEKPFTDPADCTATNGTSSLFLEAILHRSVMVPEPTETMQPAPSMASSTSATASSSA
jgi:hypothetical protein